MKAVGELRQDTGAGDFLLLRQNKLVSPLRMPFGDAREGFDHDGDFDRARRSNALFASEGIFRARVEVLRVEVDRSLELRSLIAHASVEPSGRGRRWFRGLCCCR